MMSTLLRYQPTQTLERRYSSSSSNNSSPTNEHYHINTNTTAASTSTQHTTSSSSYMDMNPHYQYLQSLYNDKDRELQHIQQIISTQFHECNNIYMKHNAINEIFYREQKSYILQWEQDAIKELEKLKEKLETYISHYTIHIEKNQMNSSSSSSNSNGIGTNNEINKFIVDTSSSSSSSDDD